MYNFSVIEIKDSKWSQVVSKCKTYDFHHTRCYHQLENDSHTALLCVASYFEDCIALPIVIREIPGTDLFDCTSVYGYCGPIATKEFNELSDKLIRFFKENLIDFFKSQNIISAFSRLNPLIETDNAFQDFGILKDINRTIAIDLRLSLEDQRKQYSKSNKPQISKLRRTGFEIVEAETNKEIDAFVTIYLETMDRVGAANAYFFDSDYFYDFLNNSCFKTKLLIVKKEGEIVAGGIFSITNKIMQYHLSGTTEKYLRVTPMKLILDEARIIGSALGLDFLHLGGGVGGSDEDSLFAFKSSFSNYSCQYKIWQLIVDKEKYNDLVEKLNVPSDEKFFPLYRYSVSPIGI
jgi:hypothetical protein